MDRKTTRNWQAVGKYLLTELVIGFDTVPNPSLEGKHVENPIGFVNHHIK